MISKRLAKIENFVTNGFSVVDIGCDHAYLPISLVGARISPRAVAADIKKGPLGAARKNIIDANLEDKIITRMSNGLEKIRMFEADTLIISGLGGNTIIEILNNGLGTAKSFREIILEPQSHYKDLRRFLYENELLLIDEDMVEESNKYYPILKIATRNGLMTKGINGIKIIHSGFPIFELGDLEDFDLEYGPYLIRTRNKVLYNYLTKKLESLKKMRMNFFMINSATTSKRLEEVETEIENIKRILKDYET